MSRSVYWSVFGLFVLLFAIIFAIYPFTGDDLWYTARYEGFLQEPDKGALDAFLGTVLEHYIIDTSRLSNPVYLFTVILSRPLGVLIVIVCFTIGFGMMTKLSDIKIGETVKLIFLMFLTVFMVNWHEHMFCLNFAFNYVVILPVYFGAFLIFLGKRKVKVGWLVLMGVVLGAWHESYAISFIGSACVLMVLKKEYRTTWRTILVISTIVGLLWILAWPSFQTRLSVTHVQDSPFRRFIYTFPWLFVVGGFVVSLLVRKWRNVCKDPIVIICLVSGFLLCIVLLRTYYIRSFTPAFFLSACALCRILQVWFPKIVSERYIRGCVCGVALLAIVCTHLVAVARESVIVRECSNNTVSLAKEYKGDGKDFFAPVRYPWHASWLTLMRPDQDLFIPGYGLNSIITFFAEGDARIPYILPVELKDYTAGAGTPFESDQTYRMYKGYIVCEDLSTDKDHLDVYYSLFNTWPVVEHCYVENLRFIGADGGEYLYVAPIRSKLTTFLGNPVDVRIP